MNSTRHTSASPGADEQVLAGLVDQLTAHLQAGRYVNLDEFAAGYPEHRETLRQLMPSLQALAGMGSASGHTGLDDTRPYPPVDHNLPFGRLGDFRLIREIGRGGMGVVYEAEQLSLSRCVALKLLSLAAALDPRHRQRFMNEAQAAARLHHPNIVPVFAVGCEHGVHYYAMQYIEGHTLAALIKELEHGGTEAEETGPRKVSSIYARLARSDFFGSGCQTRSRAFFQTAASLGIQAAEALDYAHQIGLVHRDVKPANLLLDERGNLWVTDFGLARFQTDPGVTQTGDVIGTFRYMSPEQALARRGVVDQRTDIYSLGVTLYELLTQRPLFEAQTRQELLYHLQNTEPLPPRRLNGSVPVELETIVLKALSKNPEDRYGTAQDMADDLRRFISDKPILARRPPLHERARRWLRRRRSVVRAAACSTVVTLAALVWGLVYVAGERDDKERSGRQARQAVDEMYTEVAEKWLATQPYLEPLQRDFLLKALAFYESFSQTAGGDPAIRLETAKAQRRVGDIQRRLGQTDKARAAYRGALSRLEDLSRSQPSNPHVRAELAGLLNHQGDCSRVAGELGDARQAHERAVVLFAELVNENPDAVDYRFGLAGAHNNLGLVLHSLHDDAVAAKTHLAAIEIFRELVQEQPEQPALRHALAQCHANLAVLFRDTGRSEEAEKEAYRAVALWKALLEAYPNTPQYRQGQGVNYLNLGLLFAKTGRPREAIGALRLAVATLEKLATEFPLVPVYADQLRDARKQLGVVDHNKEIKS
jgi:serine/threonine protein kinase